MKIAFRMEMPTSETLLSSLGLGPKETKSEETKSQEETKSEESNSEESKSQEESKPKEKQKRERQIAVPKDSATFFRARAKNPSMFKFTPDGNLQVPEMRGQPAKVIELPQYRQATEEEIQQDELERFEELKGIETEFDETFKLLKAAMTEWKQTGFTSNILKYQRDLQRLDAQRTALRSPVRWIKEFKNLATNEILLDETYEVRKIGYPVSVLRTRTTAFDKLIRIGVKGEAEAEGEAEGKEAEGEAEAEAEGKEEEEEFIVFSGASDPEHGFLSPDTMVEFIFNATKYNCLLQAFEGERLTMLKRNDVRIDLLKSRNPKIMRVVAARVTGQVENPVELLINILKALITQHPNYVELLQKTETATLVYAEAKDGVLGVGMASTDPQIMEKTAWKGKNFLGQAWMVVRDTLPSPKETEGLQAQSGGSYTEHGTTLKESNERRGNVLKGMYRHARKINLG